MEFTLVVLMCAVGLSVAAPATKTEVSPLEIKPLDLHSHPKLGLFQGQNYTLDEVLEALQQEKEEQGRSHATSLKKKRWDEWE